MSKLQTPEDEVLSREKFLNSLAETYLIQDAILNSTELSVVSVNKDGVINSFNPAAEKMLGYSHQELIGKETPIILHDWDEVVQRAHELSEELASKIEPGFESFVASVRRNKTADRREWTYIRKDKTRFPVLLSVSGIWDEHGNVMGFLGIATEITEQKKADEQLRKSRLHLETLISSIDDLVFEVTRQGTYSNIWTKNEKLLLLSRDKYIGNSIHDVLDGQLLELFGKAVEDVFASKTSKYVEYPVPRENQWRAAKVSYIHEDSVLILVRDISEKKAAEQRLLESEQKFRLLAENLPGTIYLCRNDANYSMVYLNDNVEELTGYSASEFISNAISFVQLYHPEDAPKIFLEVDEALTQRKKFSVTYRIKHRSGNWRWLEEHGIGVYNQEGLHLIEGYLQDITEQKEKEAELIQSRNDVQAILSSLDDIVIEIDEDGYYKKVWANRPEQLFFSAEAHEGKTIWDLLPTHLAKGYHQSIISALAHASAFTFEYPSIRKGDDSWFSARFTAIKQEGTQKRSVSVLIRNVTERRKFEQELVISKSNLETATHELQEQNNQLNEFTQILSHNLRSPVGNIGALISLLNEKSSIDDFREIFDKLKSTSANLQETLNELVETLQINRGALAERIPLRFTDTLAKVKQDLTGEIITTRAQIESDFSAAEEILYSKTYLDSILLNLLSNALKYRSPKRPLVIKIKTEAKDGKTLLHVSDNGLGINLKRYGGQLFGLRKTFHENRDAKGVGLFLTKTQIKAMGGNISAESEVDKGTTFTIEF
jgi:PAS domain S-box-containing protein